LNKPGRNAPCPCGSGKKYKKCCFGKSGKEEPPKPAPTLEEYMGKMNILQNKIAKIEALYAGATSEGEKEAAGNALDRLIARMQNEQKIKPDIEMKFTGLGIYAKNLFLALLQRYGLKPYRRYRQKRTTVMVKGPKDFLSNVVWAEFQELSKILHQHLLNVTHKIIAENICSNVEDEEEIQQIEG
jgi:hypothetical protein